jgi:hypothetical protein
MPYRPRLWLPTPQPLFQHGDPARWEVRLPATTILEQYRIADFLEWNEGKQLELSPVFQRRSIWTQQAKVVLIDTILRQLPIPKIYIRTLIDPATRKAFREVVDGQQRLRAIIEFGDDKFTLSRRAREFSGLRYSTLPEELQETFLTYAIAVDQLINATNDDVLEIFARLNSYTVTLTAAEKRHATYQSNFKWAVHEMAQSWARLWEEFRIISVRDRLRMADDSLMAEMFGVILRGVSDGGSSQIERLYRTYDSDWEGEDETRGAIDGVLEFLIANFGELLQSSRLSRAPQFLMLFAALSHSLIGIPAGQLGDDMPERVELLPTAMALDRLARLAEALEAESPPSDPLLSRFWLNSKGSTQRIAGRRVRFLAYWDALT